MKNFFCVTVIFFSCLAMASVVSGFVPGEDQMEVFSSFLAFDTAGGNYNSLHMGVDIVSNGENVDKATFFL